MKNRIKPCRAAALWCGLFLVASASWCRAQATRPSDLLEKLDAYPDLIAYNGRIAVMDDRQTTVQALAVRGRRVLRLGTSAEILELAGPKTQRIDLKGRTVLPGLIDSHTHPHIWLLNHIGSDPRYQVDPQLKLTPILGLNEKDLERMNKDGILEKIGGVVRKRANEVGPRKWVLVNIPMKEGAIEADEISSVISKKVVTTEDLDKLAPDNPVLMGGSLMSNVYNSEAKKMISAGIQHDMHLLTPVDLRVWYFLIYDIILKGKTDAVATMLRHELEENASFGVTTVSTHVEPREVLKALTELDRRDEMPIRWGWVHRTGYSLANDPAEFYRLIGDFHGQGSDYLWNAGVGEEGWDAGAGGPCTQAVPKDPKLREQFAKLEQCAGHKPGTPKYNGHLEALKQGLRLADVHATNDGTIDIIFELMDQTMRETGMTLDEVRAKRHFFDHPRLIRPDQIPKLAKYGLWMNMQATGFVRSIEEFQAMYGDEPLKWFTPVKSMMTAGARFSLATDAHYAEVPRESQVGAWPWYGFWPLAAFYVTREWNGKVWGPEEKLDRVSALRGWTTWAAESVLREKDLGSLDKGKLADFIVLDRDYFSIPERDIANIKNLLTVVGGKVVFKSPNF